MEPTCYYVYILASRTRALYVGMTEFLMSRLLQHRAGEGEQFSCKYRDHRLVYYEVFGQEERATQRRAEIKGWRHEKKVVLIEKKNPAWDDLAAGWGSPVR